MSTSSMQAREQRRRLASALAVSVLLVWAAAEPSLARADATPAPAGSAPTTGADEPTAILPVWALLDGDTPVAGARVRVYAIRRRANGKPGRPRLLRPLNPVAAQRTYDSGIALLEFARLPRTFVVEVSGGQAQGRPLRGFLSARVHGYRSPEVVHVTPVTTLVERWEHDTPGINRARVRVTVNRALGIPRWADVIDILATDRWFDGDTFLERTRGRLGRALPKLLRQIRSGASLRFEPAAETLARASDASSSSDAQRDALWAGLLAGAPALISGIISLTNLAVGVIVGWLLPAVQAALSAGLPADGSARVLQELKALSTQVTDLHAAVAQSKFEQLVAGTQDTLATIKYAHEQLKVLAELPSTDTTRKNFAQTIQDYIGKNLIDAPEKLHQRLASNIPVAEGANIIKAASQAVGKQKRFFDEKSTASIKSVYDYFTVYQTQLAVLLANYWNSQPETYSAAVKTANLERLRGYLADQKTPLKPAPPSGTVIDTRTNKMWTRNFQGNPVSADNFCEFSGPGVLVRPAQTNGPRTIPGLPFGNWQLPDETEFRTLIDGHGDAKPVHWLWKEAGMSQLQTDAPPAAGLAFMRDKDAWSLGCVSSRCFREVRIKRFDLWNDRIDTTDVLIGSCQEANCFADAIKHIKGATMYVRDLGANESYWWQ
jgi:hypothetical protein